MSDAEILAIGPFSVCYTSLPPLISFLLYRPWDKDRYFAPDMATATNLLVEGKVNILHNVICISLPILPFLSSLAGMERGGALH